MNNRRSNHGLYVPFRHKTLSFQASIECLRERYINRTYLAITSVEEASKTKSQVAGNREIPIALFPGFKYKKKKFIQYFQTPCLGV